MQGGAAGRRRPDRGLRGAGGLFVRALDEEHVLLGVADRRAGAASSGSDGAAPVIELWRSVTPRGRIMIALALAILLALPVAADRYVLSVLTLIFYFAYVGQAWNLMMGYAGQLSLGHALYVGVGGYVAALMWLKLGIGPWLGVFAAGALGAALVAVFARLAPPFRPPALLFPSLTPPSP